MVRAILAGTKTQTRRVAKIDSVAYGKPVSWVSVSPATTGIKEERCHYGAPGDRLWVREAWRVGQKWDTKPPRELPVEACSVYFEAGGHAANTSDGWRVDNEDVVRPGWLGKLRPGMFMPRWASRITLEITGVRVERLRDISEADAMAEGMAWDDAVYDYSRLWESINGPGSWAANSWVWVVEFKRA
jgi:hypothetical protein